MPFSCMHSWKRISSCEFRPTCSRLQNTFLWWHQQQFQATQQEVLNPCHTCNFIRRFCHETLSHDKVAVCNCACRTLQLLCINKNWPISVHRTFMAKLRRIEFWSIKKELRDCWEVARRAMSHLQFCRAIKLQVWHLIALIWQEGRWNQVNSDPTQRSLTCDPVSSLHQRLVWLCGDDDIHSNTNEIHF